MTKGCTLLHDGFAKHASSISATEKSKLLEEEVDYLIVQSKVDDSFIYIRSERESCSLLQKDASSNGMVIRRGCFYAGESGIRVDAHTVDGNNSGYRSSLLGQRFFQIIRGSGIYWIRASGAVYEIKLSPGQMVQVDPTKIIAWTESVAVMEELSSVSYDYNAKKASGRDFDFALQADARGGEVLLSSCDE